jgi:hypothetical protein
MNAAVLLVMDVQRGIETPASTPTPRSTGS